MTALEAVSLDAWAYEQVDMFPHYSTLTRYARECETIVEFGVRGGVSTWALLDGLPAGGYLYSVDIADCVVPPRVTSDPRWTFVIGDDLDPQVQVQLPSRVVDVVHFECLRLF